MDRRQWLAEFGGLGLVRALSPTASAQVIAARFN